MKNKLMNDLKESMKNKEIVRKNTIQLIRSSILQYEKDNQIEIDDNKIIDIITKERKSRLDALKDFEKAKRDDLIFVTKKEIEVLEEYLPKQLTDEELRFEIAVIISDVDAREPGDIGIVMRTAKDRIGNKADGKRISAIVKEYLEKRQKELNEKKGDN